MEVKYLIEAINYSIHFIFFGPAKEIEIALGFISLSFGG